MMPQDAPPNKINHPKELPGAPMTSVLGFDHACIGCEYNLLGIAIGGVCPECSMPVESSLKRRLLRHAPLGSISGLRQGARCITIAALLPLAILGVTVISSVLFSFASQQTGMIDAFQILAYVLLFAIWGLFTIGWWLLTKQWYGFDLVPETDSVRRRCRFASVAFSAGWVVFTAISLVTSTSGFSLAPFVMSLVLLVLWMVHLRLGTKRVQQIALALPSKGLARYARTVYWVLLSNILLVIAWVVLQGIALQIMFGATGGAGAGLILGIVGGIVSILTVVLALASYAMYIGLFRRLWIGLSKVEKTQRADQQPVTAEA